MVEESATFSGRGRIAPGRQAVEATLAEPQARSENTTFLFVFVFSLLLPFKFSVVGAEMFPARLLILVMFFPLLSKFLSGAAGKIRHIDILMMLHCVWILVTLLFHHGIARFPLAVITSVDIFGGWMIGRVLIRNSADFKAMVRAMVYAAIFMLPFAVLEFITNINLLQKIFDPVFDTFHKGWSSYGRLGFERVMGGFAHPILFGLFCSMIVGTSYYAYREKISTAVMFMCLFVFMSFMSLSSGPFLSAIIQVGLIVYGRIMGAAWRLLFWLSITGYIVIDLLSNRTPITIAINYITFNSDTAWYRVATWRYGSAELWRNPIFGIGLNDWTRPRWLGSSIDNFWLLNGMRYGVPGFLFLAGAIAVVVWTVTKTRDLPEEPDRLRTGYMITLVGLLITACTVHIWGALGIYFMCFLGAGVWFVDHSKASSVETPKPGDVAIPDEPEALSKPASRYARSRTEIHRRK